jgi:predicted chitinase
LEIDYNMAAIQPTKNTGLIVDEFIRYANQHLLTVKGMITTVSTYAGPSTAPGVVMWNGYQVAGAKSSRDGASKTASELFIGEDVNPNNTPLTEAQYLAAEESLAGSTEEDPINGSQSLAAGLSISEDIVPPNPALLEQTEKEITQVVEESVIQAKEQLKKEGAKELIEETPVKLPKIPNYKTKVKIPDELVVAMRKWGVGKTPEDRAHFLGQCDHETGGFSLTAENLKNYAGTSSKRIREVFKSRVAKYSDAEIDVLKKDEYKWGDIVYGPETKKGQELGNTSVGDGSKYKGRGWIQITGKVNYIGFTKADTPKRDYVANPQVVEQRMSASDASCWFWKMRQFTRHSNVVTLHACGEVSYRVNGSRDTVADRWKKTSKYWTELQRDPTLWS